MDAQPQAPRSAATVVVLRPRPSQPFQLFMVRRSSRSAFMPDALVFPGGKVDAADGTEDDDAAFVTAARRECLEEAQIDLSAVELRWFDTWITPELEPRRFYARFYLAVLPPGSGDDAIADGHETHEGRWATAAELLDTWLAGQVDLPPPTACTLMRLAAPGWQELLAWTPAQARAPILPKFSPAAMAVVMPHDPEYEALPGAAMPACARLDGLPRRFVREGTIWRPIP